MQSHVKPSNSDFLIPVWSAAVTMGLSHSSHASSNCSASAGPVRGGFGNSDSMLSGSLAPPIPPWEWRNRGKVLR